MPWRRPLAALAAAGVALSIGMPVPVAAADPSLPVRLTIVAPLTAPPGITGLITAEALAQYTSPVGLLNRQLDAMYGRPVAIGVDPMIIASIRVLGTSAPLSAMAWLDRLATAPNQTFPLAYADADLTLATQAGASTVPVPTSFSGLDPALFGGQPEDDEQTPSPTPSPSPSGPPDDGTPTVEEILAWPYTVTDLAWPRENTLVADDLVALAGSGYESVIVSSTNITRPASATPTARAGSVTALVSDLVVSEALDAAVAAPDDESWDDAMDAVFAAIASSAQAQPDDRATVFASLDRGIPVLGSRLAATLDALETSSAVTGLALTMALGIAPDDGEIVDQAQPADRVVQTTLLLSEDEKEVRFSKVAANPEAIAGPRRLALLGLLSAAWTSNPTGWANAVTDNLQVSIATLASVRVEATSQVNFFASKSVIPIPVTNDLAEPVTVFVTIDPNTPLLAVEDTRVEVTVPPNSQANAQVPVQAIGNGNVTLTVSLSSSEGTEIGPIRLVRVNVVAGWEGPVFTALAVLVVAFFAFGIVRTILRRRKQVAADE